MAIENQISFPVTGPGGKETKIRITLKYKKRDDGTIDVTQVELAVGGGAPVLMPDPPVGEGTPPSPPPSMEASGSNSDDPQFTGVWGRGKHAGTHDRQTRFNVMCHPEPPTVTLYEPDPDKDGEYDYTITPYIIDHATQDLLVDFLRNPQWTWAPKEVPKEEKK